MKHIKWKTLIITSLVTLVPILFGVLFWNQLPDVIATHFGISGNPDGFSSKGFAVFGLPLLLMALQIFGCIVNDVNAYKHGEKIKFERFVKWIIPCISIVLQAAIFAFALGGNVDIRRIAMIIVGAEFIGMGNYLPKLNYIKNYNLDTEKARKINRFVGIETVIMGVLALATIFLPTIFSVAWLVLIVPYVVIGLVYGIAVAKR